MSSSSGGQGSWDGGAPPEGSALAGPRINPEFERSLDALVALARGGHRPDAEMFNPTDQWLLDNMRVFQDLPPDRQKGLRDEGEKLRLAALEVNAAGRAAARAGPDVVIRLDSGGVGFFSQLGVARRPEATHYFVDGFARNRDSLSFSEENQALFAPVLAAIVDAMKGHFASGGTIVQSDRAIGDAPGRTYHARQLLFGTHYLQLPYMWRQLTFQMPEDRRADTPDILEVSLPHWLDDLGLPEELKERVRAAGLAQMVFKAPTKGLSLHLGFDYAGEHKMGPLSIAMFKAKQAGGLAVQAALSVARIRTMDGGKRDVALVIPGPSLHGKSTLTISLDFEGSEASKLLALPQDPDEGVYPMNDDIVLLRPLAEPVVVERQGRSMRITHSIDGTEDNFYAVPFGLTREDDPLTYDVVRGAPGAPNSQETMENVPVDVDSGIPNTLENPVRNMRMILSRSRLVEHKGVGRVLEAISGGGLTNSVHVPMEAMDGIFWQGVMRQSTVIPPLVRLTRESYVRALMFGEAVRTGAASGAIGQPYIEYFSDPFIIGLEDENANAMHALLQTMEEGGMPQYYSMFNTGGIGADSNDAATGARYRKIPRELTLLLQESLLRGALKFEHDPLLGADVAVAVVNGRGEEVVDLRQEWLPRNVYGEEEYARRVLEMKRKRYYGENAADRAGILRYTKATVAIMDLADIPAPQDERELAWLFSFVWSLDRAYDTVAETAASLAQGQPPSSDALQGLHSMYEAARSGGLRLPAAGDEALRTLGVTPP